MEEKLKKNKINRVVTVLNDEEYANFIKNKEIELCGRDALPKEALEALVKMKESIYSHIDIKHVVNI